MVEIWKPIKGFEGVYEISNLGNVKRINYRNTGFDKNLVPKVNNKGYLWVELWKDKKRHCMQIHRLVAMHFIPNNDERRTVINHIDENPKNNVVTNLEWCTFSENSQAYLNNHKGDPNFGIRKKRNKYHTKYSDVNVKQTRLDGTLVAIHDNISTITRTLHYHNTSILECCIGKRKTAYGYKWQFAN